MSIILISCTGCNLMQETKDAYVGAESEGESSESVESGNNENKSVENENSENENNESQNSENENTSVEKTMYNNIDALMPVDWYLATDSTNQLAIIMDDFNEDDTLDVALVIENNESGDFGKPRKLIVAFGQKEGTYEKVAESDTAILASESGGIWGDPFEDIHFNRKEKELIVSHYGGSNWRWYTTDTYKIIDGVWVLINKVEGSYSTGDQTMDTSEEMRYDYLSGEYSKRTFDENNNEVLEMGTIDDDVLKPLDEN